MISIDWLITFHAFLFLMSQGLLDYRYKVIDVRILILSAIMSICQWIVIFSEGRSIEDYLLGVIPGMIILVVSIISGGNICKGDAFLIMVLGMNIGISQLIYVLAFGFLLAAAFSTVILIRKRGSGNTRIPLTPFIAGSYTVELSLLIPMILAIIFIVIFLSFYYHDRIVIEGTAYEIISESNISGEYATEESVDISFRSRVAPKLIGKWIFEVNSAKVACNQEISLKCRMHVWEGILLSDLISEVFSFDFEYEYSNQKESEYLLRAKYEG